MALFPPLPGPCAITSICPPSENLPAVNKPAARGARGPCAGAAQVGLGLALAARQQRSRHSGCQGVLRRELNLEILLKALNLDRETLTLTSEAWLVFFVLQDLFSSESKAPDHCNL